MTAERSSSERWEEWASAPNNEEVCTEAHEDYEEEKPQPNAGRVIRRKACVGAPVAAKAKVKLGPTGSFGRDALRRVLARCLLI